MGNRIKIDIENFMYDNDSEKNLSDFHIELKDGDILWLNGEVGCGKTTLLKIIAGIIPNFESGFLHGNIILNGQRIGERTFHDTAFCFQHSDNQLLFDSVRRQFWGDEEDLKIFFKEVGINEISEKSVMDLSRGQRKFVALMSTVRKKRKIYIFDEPLDLLDYDKKKKTLEEIKKISKSSIVIISSHDQEVKQIANIQMNYSKVGGWRVNGSLKLEKNRGLQSIAKKKSAGLIIKTKDLRFSFTGDNQELRFPDINIYKNEVVGIIGGNGSGKTTLLKLLSNIISSPHSVLVEKDFVNFGFMFQNVNRQLFGNTVYEELFIGLSSESEELVSYANFLLKELNLYHLRNLHPTFLSGGQKQKLVFASLLMHKPEVLFLDEIFTNLDIESINAIFSLITEYRGKNDLTVILTDQESDYLKGVCEKILYVDSGMKS